MSAAPPALYVAPSRGVAAGAVFLHVPIAYQPRRPVVASVVSGDLLQIEQDFERAWRSAPPRIRDHSTSAALSARPPSTRS